MWPLGVLGMGSLQQEEAHSTGPQSSASPQLLSSVLQIVTQGNMRKSLRWSTHPFHTGHTLCPEKEGDPLKVTQPVFGRIGSGCHRFLVGAGPQD